MRNKILKAILSAALVVLTASVLLITSILYYYFGNLQQQQLKDELHLAAEGTAMLGADYLNGVEDVSYRLTWIAEDGTVLFDNQADVKEMENHAFREEIQEAFIHGTGSSRRYSTTLTRQNIYEALRLQDGSVLRISDSRATVMALVGGMLQPVFVIILAAVILSVWMSDKMAGKIVEPLNRLNLDAPLENDAYEELSPLLGRIYAQKQEIQRQVRILKQKQEEFNQITQNMKETLVLLDNAGNVVSMNPAAKSWFDKAVEGESFSLIDGKENVQNAIEEAKKKGICTFREEKNGREYQFEVSCIEAEKNLYGIVILGFDITEQVNAEKNRREFTANVSHELKTPLQSIIGSAELLENGIVKAEDIPDFVKRIHKEASGMVCLIEDIIRLSQLDEGVEMAKEEVSLKALSMEVCETLADLAGQKNIRMEVTGEEGKVNGVRSLLYEIIYNLCDNAIKYNHPGGKVKVIIKDRKESICLKVLDSGIGIEPEEQEKIFERFYRVDKSHSKQSGGTGLGLSIVKHAVQYHQGELYVKSKKKKGTEISIFFKEKS